MTIVQPAAARGRTAHAARRAFAELRQIQPIIVGALGLVATLASLVIVGLELRQQGMVPLRALTDAGPGFWAAFIGSVLVEPVALCWMLHRLAGTGHAPLVPLIRKQAINTLLFGYAGETLFLAWLERQIGSARAAFALVADMAIISALVNNIATLGLLLLMWNQIAQIADARLDARLVGLAIAFAAVPLLLLGWRRHALHRNALPNGSLQSTGAPTIVVTMALRTIVYCGLMAAAWHFAMPEVPIRALLLLTTARMVVCRLPIIPNKDLAFAGAVALFLGPDQKIAAVIAGVALLTLVAEMVMLMIAQVASVARPTHRR